MGVGSWSNGWDAEVRSDGDGGERFFMRGEVCSEIELECGKSLDEPEGAILRSKPPVATRGSGEVSQPCSQHKKGRNGVLSACSQPYRNSLRALSECSELPWIYISSVHHTISGVLIDII